MEVVINNKRRRSSLPTPAKIAKSTPRSAVSMYIDPPLEEITLQEFEELALKRLTVLKHAETLSANKAKGAELWKAIESSLRKHGLDDARRDHISHFIVRLAYCRSEEKRRWLIKHEQLLFRCRYEATANNPAHLDAFFEENNLEFKPVEVMSERMRQTLRDMNPHTANEDFFEVPFEDALDLLAKRRILLNEGMGYVARRDLVMIVVARFRIHLSKQLASTAVATRNARQDSRIAPLVNNLSSQHLGPSFKPKFTGQVTREQIPELAKRSFPLCMQHSYEGLRKESHLKHGGRMQLGLFLKGIGLSLEDALVFWRQSFARKTPAEAFNKQYAYNVRHNYGKEGKRTSYTPYSCMKIIKSTPAPDDHYGCPFRHYDQDRLEAKLKSNGIPYSGVDEIMGLVKGMHYQIACTKYFAYTHEGHAGEGVGNHPNEYFEASKKWQLEKEGVQAGTTTEATKPKPDEADKEEQGTFVE